LDEIQCLEERLGRWDDKIASSVHRRWSLGDVPVPQGGAGAAWRKRCMAIGALTSPDLRELSSSMQFYEPKTATLQREMEFDSPSRSGAEPDLVLAGGENGIAVTRAR
jgi:hypothetical protein